MYSKYIKERILQPNTIFYSNYMLAPRLNNHGHSK